MVHYEHGTLHSPLSLRFLRVFLFVEVFEVVEHFSHILVDFASLGHYANTFDLLEGVRQFGFLSGALPGVDVPSVSS